MRTRTSALGSVSALLVLTVAHAAPPNRGGGDFEGRRVRLAPSFSHRMAERIQKNGQSITRQQVIEKFDPSKTVDLADGSKLTVQELMDSVEASEQEAVKKGTTLTALKESQWFRATTLTKLTTQQGLVAEEHKAALQKRASLIAGVTIMGCDADRCVPRDTEKSAKWDKTKGDEDTVAVYTSFNVTENTPSAYDARCTATWDNGVHLVGGKYSLVKLTAEAEGTRKPTVSASAKAALYVLGQASPIWSKQTSFTAENLDRTFKTPKATMNVPFIPLVSVEGGVQAAASLSLRPSVSGVSDANSSSVGCAISLAPRLTASVDPEVKIVVGLPKLAKIAEGGVKADLTALDVSLPTTLGVKMSAQPLSLGVQFKSDVKASFLKGKLVAWYKIKDICELGFCLIEDGLGIKTHGEIILWQDENGLAYASSLADINGSVPFQRPGGPLQMAGPR